MSRSRLWQAGLGLLCALALGAGGCSKCGEKTAAAGPAGVERVLPRNAAALVVVPSLQDAGARLTQVQRFKISAFLAQLQGFGDGTGFGDALVGQLGIDVRSTEAMEQAGIDATRALGAAVLVNGQVVLALPVKDAGRLHTTLENLSYRRLGAGAGSEQKVGEVVVKQFSPQQGKPPRLGYVLAHGFALVATDEGIAQLPQLAALAEGDALSKDAAYAAARERLGKRPDALAWLPPGTPLLARAPVSGGLAAATLTPQAFTVDIDAAWRGDVTQLKLLQPRPAADLLGLLPRDAFVVARFTGDPNALGPWVDLLLGPYLKRAFAEGGLDVKNEVLAKLAPGVVVALSLAPRPPMDKGLPTFDIRQTNPFTYAHLSGAVPAQSAAIAPTLDKVASLAPRFGAEMKKVERQGHVAFVTSYAQGEGVHLASLKDRVVFASPVQRLDALLASDGTGGSPVDGLGTGALALSADLVKLADAVRELPSDAWGIGGFAIKATTVRWLDATDDLRAIGLTLSAKEKSVQAKLVLTLGAPQAMGP